MKRLDLIPKTKRDMATAEAAVRAGFPAVETVIPELLEWIQDYNWPVARVLAPFLGKIGMPMVPHLRQVLDGDDQMWKYWIICCVLDEMDQNARERLLPLVRRIAERPTPEESADEVHRVAGEFLARVQR